MLRAKIPSFPTDTLIIFFGLILTAPIHFFVTINWDVAWFLYIAEKIMNGSTLYTEIIEVNPPLIVWLHIPVVLVSRLLGLSPILTFQICILTLIGMSLLLCKRHIKTVLPDTQDRSIFLGCATVALVLLPVFDFGQREHLMLTMVLPYLLLSAARAQGTAVKSVWLTGILAGLGMCIKPYFILLWITVEAYVIFHRRQLLRPEALAVFGVAATYISMIGIVTPQYIPLLSFVAPLYFAIRQQSFGYLLAHMFITIFTMFYALLLRPHNRHLFWILITATISLLLVALMQGKGYAYHLYPATALALLIMAITLVEKGIASFPPLSLFLALTITFTILLVKNITDYGGNPARSHTQLGQLIRLAQQYESIYIFSVEVSRAFPLISYAEKRWTSRFPSLWFLLPVPQNDTYDRIRDTMARLVMSDLQRDPPSLMMVDNEHKADFHGGPFDYLGFFSAVPGFASFMESYHPLMDIGDVTIYKKYEDPA